MSLTARQVAALRELEQVWPHARAVIIGATALGFYYDMRWRQTADVDLTVTIELEDFAGLLYERPGWSQHPKKKHEFSSPQGVKIDLLPAGQALLEEGKIRWPSGQVMSLTGMDLAFSHAESHVVPDNGTVLVAPPPVISILKMASYCDRPADRERDLEDIAHLLDEYVDDDSDRRFEEALGQDFDLAPAYLFGIDVARATENKSHEGLIERFLDRVNDPDSMDHALMRRKGPTRWSSDAALVRRLDAFRTGLADGQR